MIYSDKNPRPLRESEPAGFTRRSSQWDIGRKSVKQYHIDGMIIIPGLAADRPTNNPLTEIVAYFATDTNVLSIWNGTAWKSVTLT